MSVYVITGVSRGIGYEFLKQISAEDDLVIGLVRDKAATEKKIRDELGDRPNVHILHADLTKYESLKNAAAEVATIVSERGGGIDYLVANAALVPYLGAYGPIGSLADKVEEVEAVSHELLQINVIGNIHLFNLFLPLIMKGKTKKVIAISSGLADLDLTNDCDIDVGSLYAASKASLNVIVAKFSAQYKQDGVLFLSICPGMVDVGREDNATPEDLAGLSGFVGKLAAYSPHFKGPDTPEESVKMVRKVWENASIEAGLGGAFISHFGNKQWV